MPCAGPDHSCNSLISIRSPFGEVRLGAPGSAKPGPPLLGPFIRICLALREALAHRRQRGALALLDKHLLKDAGISEADAAQEIRKWFWK